MRIFYVVFSCVASLFFVSCGPRKMQQEKPVLAHMQIVDRNGFNETISAEDRLNQYQYANFLDPQPYKKVVRVFKKNKEGKTPSALTSYHESGGIFQYLETVNGRAHGIYKEWYPSGKLKLQTQVIEGIGDLSLECINTWVFDGAAIIYDENGAKQAEFYYDKGALSGVGTLYHPNGNIKKTTLYENNLEQGQQTELSETGDAVCITQFSNGKKHGALEFFKTKDLPMFQEKYDQGFLVEGKYYDLSNTLISTVDKGSGIKSIFSTEGLVAQIEIQKGKEEGVVKLFYPGTCFLKAEYICKSGSKHGEEIQYNFPQDAAHKPSSKMCLMWQEGKLQGKIKTYYENGQLESEREFYNNKKNGPSSAFYTTGQLMLLEEYENDILVQGYYWKKGDPKEVSQVIQGEGVATLYDSSGIFLKKVSYKKGEPLDE